MTNLPELPRHSTVATPLPRWGRGAGAVPGGFFIADDIAEALRELGAEVVGPVPRFSEALALIEGAGRIDLAVLDVNIEGKACFVVGDALSAHGIPFIFATGYDRGFLPARFRNVPFWEKPFEARSLARALRDLCDAPSRRG
jgi:CheY-like chemotaxis protein